MRTQEPHQRSSLPVFAMEGTESLPFNSPWAINSISIVNISAALETEVQAPNMTIEFLDILVDVDQC